MVLEGLTYQLNVAEPVGLRPDELVTVERKPSDQIGEVKIVFPSSAPEVAVNKEAFGSFIADWIVGEVEVARKEGKIPVLDLFTGGTSEAVWPALKKLVDAKVFNPTGIIFVGHEVAAGEPKGPMDYEGFRIPILKDTFGKQIKEIISSEQVKAGQINGNYIPMLQVKVDRKDFPDTREGTRQFLDAEREAVQKSADRFDAILHALVARGDVKIISLYGVGKDGHVDEIQPNRLTGAVNYPASHVMVYDRRLNSRAAGTFPWEGDAHRYHNDMYFPVSNEDSLQEELNGFHGARQLMGWGWEDLLLPESLMLAFNSSDKAFAFQLTMEGSLDGILTQDGQEVMKMKRQVGEGEAILPELLEYARILEKDDFLVVGSIATLENQGKLTSKTLFQLIYEQLFEWKAAPEDSYYHDIFEKMWKFANRSLRKQAPVAVLLRLRALLGRDTIIVAAPEVVRGTRYARLVDTIDSHTEVI